MNPCPCGHFGSRTQKCTCTQSAREKYLRKLSGPLMDRIDLHIEADGVTYGDLSTTANAEPSATVKSRVEAARALQRARFVGDNTYCNAKMTQSMVKKYCALDAAAEKIFPDVPVLAEDARLVGTPSTIVKVERGEVSVLRAGATPL